MKYFIIFCLVLSSFGCSENYSNGERIGVITQFSKTGLIWKSWEGHLNVTQTGMNSSVPFDFSIDNDKEPPVGSVETLDSAAQYGWKVKVKYHEVSGFNVFKNRGSTDHFVESVEVLDRGFSSNLHPFGAEPGMSSGRVVDTIYVVIDKTK